MLSESRCFPAFDANLKQPVLVYEDHMNLCRFSKAPVFLFFHSGGLVGNSKEFIPPWLVQACYQRKWPLISAGYRLMPQTGCDGLLEDVKGVYNYARSYMSSVLTPNGRDVIVGGASAGFFLANLVAHHLSPPPLALLSITGIPTFQNPFFSASILLTPDPVTRADVRPYLSEEEAKPGSPDPTHPHSFSTYKLTPNAEKKPDHPPPPTSPRPVPHAEKDTSRRACLYDYYLYNEMYPALLAPIDPGFGPESRALREKTVGGGREWPPTVIIQGDDDYDVSMDISVEMQDCLGEDRVKLFLAHRQGHLFEAESFWEDEGKEMDTVREAMACLDELVEAALSR